jgi:outer membrane protein
MKTFALLALLPVMVLSFSALAQESTETPKLDSAVPLTPEQLYEIALHHNPDYLKTLETLGLSGINSLSAWGTLMPSLDVSYGFSQSKSYSPTYVNPDGTVSSYPRTDSVYQAVVDTTNWTIGAQAVGTETIPVPESQRRNSGGSISLQESIPLGGQQLYGIKNARITNNLNQLQVSAYKNDLFLAVRQNYYNVLAQKQLLALSQQIADQKREFLRAAQARFEVGSVTELDVLQAEIDVGTQDNAVITARNNLRLAREDLNRTLGINLESEYPLVDSLNVFSPDYSLDSLITKADTRPDYQIVTEQVQFQENLVKSRRGQFFPVLSAGLTHSRSQLSGTNVGFTLSPRNYSTSANLSLSWNLFSGFSDKAQYEQSKVSLNNARHDRKKQELEIEREVRQAYYSLQQTYQQSDITQKNRELASRQLALEQERYRLGSASQLDLRTAQTTFEQAQSDYIANIFSFWINLAALERAVGQNLR